MKTFPHSGASQRPELVRYKVSYHQENNPNKNFIEVLYPVDRSNEQIIVAARKLIQAKLPRADEYRYFQFNVLD